MMPRVRSSRRTSLLGALLTLALVPGFLLIPWQPTIAAGSRPAVIGKRVIGHSVQGRKIVAYHLGERGAEKVVLISLMHGNEPAPRRILTNLMNGAPVHGVNLWVVPVYNPDGFAHHTRKNAHGVDPNRNYPYKWAPLNGGYESGRKPASEPETRAMMRFLSRFKPAYVLSFHQPLHAVDITQRPQFSRRVARSLRLPMSHLNCGSTCHGTMTMWFNHKFKGFALTVEYGAHPPKAKLRSAAGRILKLFGAWRGGVKGTDSS
jgi:predicted deacylase